MSDQSCLADANVLIALAVRDHLHHDVAQQWFAQWPGQLATCPITQGALVRFLIREGRSAADSAQVVEQIAASPWHEFWPDDLTFDGPVLRHVIGHRQVTDAYLVALAAHRGSRLVTLDKGLAAVHGGDLVELIAA